MKRNMQLSERVVDLPVSAAIKPLRNTGWGEVADLEVAELADPEELERLVAWQMWGPVLALRPATHAWAGAFTGGRCCEPDWSAVRPVVCRQERRAGVPMKAGELRAELREVLRRMELVLARVCVPQKYVVLKYVRMGWLRLEDVVDRDLRTVAVLYLRARRLRRRLAGVAEGER